MSEGTSIGDYIKEKTTENRNMMEREVNKYYNEEYFDSLGGPEEVIKSEFPWRGWREMFFGCLPAVREVHLIYEQGEPWGRDRDLIIGLLKQIRDEVKHARIYTNYAEQFDVEADLASWSPATEDELVEMGQASVEWDTPHHIVAAFQCGTEIQAAYMTDNLADYLEPTYPNIAESLRTISSDEGDHVHAGRLVAKRFASTGDIEKMEEITDQKVEASLAAMKSHTGNQ